MFTLTQVVLTTLAVLWVLALVFTVAACRLAAHHDEAMFKATQDVQRGGTDDDQT